MPYSVSSVLLGLVLCGALSASTITVNNGQSLQAAINSASDGDTIVVNPGTYTPQSPANWITVSKAIKIIGSPANPAQTIIQGNGNDVGVIWFQGNGGSLQGFKIQGGGWGARAGTMLNGVVSNVRFQDLIIDTDFAASSPGHGISMNAVNSVIDNCIVIKAWATGIGVSAGGGNLIINSTVMQAQTQHAFVIQESDGNAVVGNTVLGSANI
ncbi:MAG TPA: hypothetical protein VGM23_14320, partial [Armatimonadota bacterium]